MSRTFVAQYMAGEISADAIYDFVDAWHDGEGSGLSLAAFLGLADEDYTAWVERPNLLPVILASKRSGRPLSEAIADFSRAS